MERKSSKAELENMCHDMGDELWIRIESKCLIHICICAVNGTTYIVVLWFHSLDFRVIFRYTFQPGELS